MDTASFNVILLVDTFTRSRMKTNVADLAAYDVKIVNTLREISSKILEKTTTVVILEDFLRKSQAYSDLELYKDILGLKYVYIGLDDTLLSSVSHIAKTYRMDPTLLDYDMMYGIIFEDPLMQARYLEETKISSEGEQIAFRLLQDPDQSEEIRRLSENLISLYAIQRSTYHKLEVQEELSQQLKLSLQQLTEYDEVLENAYLEIIANARHLNRSLKQFEPILARDVYDKVPLSKYPQRPMIIYLKEYQELHHLNSFINILFAMFKRQYKNSVKVVRLYDSSSSKRLLGIRDERYVRLKNNFLYSDVVSNDFLIKTGNYRKMFDILLDNKNGLGILIVVDCKDHDDVVLSGQFLHISMCRNPENLGVFALDPASTIVNNQPGNPLSWDHYENYESLSETERFRFLSSRPVIKMIYELAKGYARVGV
jgi:hypothetical protein